MNHTEMVREGATRYVRHLRQLHLAAHVRIAADAIIESIENALCLEADLEVDNVPFVSEVLATLTSAEKISLHNPYLPGYGAPDARLVVVGTEHAFDFEHPRPRGPSPDACLAMADCGLHVLWLADGGEWSGELVEHISGQEPAGADVLPGHRHPYEFLYPIPAGHMWRRLSRMIAAAGIVLERGAAPRWGATAYMFELSDTAAAQQSGGALPSQPRQQFLPSILTSLEHARVLIFRGRWREPAWDAIRESLAAAFLSTVDGEALRPEWMDGPTGDYRSARSADGAKLAVLMQSPTRFGRTNAFLDAIGHLIGPTLHG